MALLCKGGWRTRALLWQLLLSAQHSSKAEATPTCKISLGDLLGSVFAAGAADTPGGKPGAGSPRQAALLPSELRAFSWGWGQRGYKCGVRKAPLATPHSHPALLLWALASSRLHGHSSRLAGGVTHVLQAGTATALVWLTSSSHAACSSARLSPFSPNPHTILFFFLHNHQFFPGKSISHSAARASPGPRGLCWKAMLAGLRGVSHPLHPTNSPAMMLPPSGLLASIPASLPTTDTLAEPFSKCFHYNKWNH